MLESVCYVPIDVWVRSDDGVSFAEQRNNVIYSEHKNSAYENINTKCLMRYSQHVPVIREGEYYSFSLQSGVVIVLGCYGEVYKTQIRSPISHSSECFSSFFELYPSPEFTFLNTSEAILKLCKNSQETGREEIVHQETGYIVTGNSVIAAGVLTIVAGAIVASMYDYFRIPAVAQNNPHPVVATVAAHTQVAEAKIIHYEQDEVANTAYGMLPFAGEAFPLQ